MIIIGFSKKTSKILPRIICRNFRHCAPIIAQPDGTLVMHQFIRRGHIERINLHARDIKILAANGWCFIYLPRDACDIYNAKNIMTCVMLTRKIAGINERIYTPDGLYKKLAFLRVFYFITS